MNVLITGASGFIGQALAQHILLGSFIDLGSLCLTDLQEPTNPTSSRFDPRPAPVTPTLLAADLTSPSEVERVFPPTLNCIFLLHGLMSGISEANLDLGLKINVDSMRLILDHLRRTNPGVMVVFASSCAVYGPNVHGEPPFTENTMPFPGSSYGAQKLTTEILLNDYSRRSLIDARICRLPTVIVRPGKPSGAASSFCSGIIREPLNGEKSVLPVDPEFPIWVTSARAVVQNLLDAMELNVESFDGRTTGRILNLPGFTTTSREMLDALKKVKGEEVVKLVEERRDVEIEKIFYKWAGYFDTRFAEELGFQKGGGVEDCINEYLEDYYRPPP